MAEIRARIIEDDVVVVRQSELVERVTVHGHTAQQVAISLGMSPAAIIFHLHKLGYHYNRREGSWQRRSPASR